MEEENKNKQHNNKTTTNKQKNKTPRKQTPKKIQNKTTFALLSLFFSFWRWVIGASELFSVILPLLVLVLEELQWKLWRGKEEKEQKAISQH